MFGDANDEMSRVERFSVDDEISQNRPQARAEATSSADMSTFVWNAHPATRLRRDLPLRRLTFDVTVPMVAKDLAK